MSSKYCDHYGYYHHSRRKLYLRIFGGVLAFIIVVLFVILLVYLILRPSKPQFYLRELSVVQFNLTTTTCTTTTTTTAAPLLTSILQATLYSRNPNSRIGIYYDKLDAYAQYSHQQVTIPTTLPTGYQGHKDTQVWSPFLYGDAIPLEPYVTEALGQDENAGLLLIDVKVDGRLRWKVGTWVSGHYHIYVNCPAFLTVSNGNGNCGAREFKYEKMATCSVEV